MVKIEHILFWILILIIVGLLIWLAFGSPEFESSLIAIGIFVAGSEILLWRAFFSIDKRTSIGFERVKLDFERVNDKLGGIENDVNEMKNTLISINKKLKIK